LALALQLPPCGHKETYAKKSRDDPAEELAES
jgi:hypothetical protein